MTERVQRGTLQVAKVLDALVEEAASDVGVTSSQFWSSFESIVSNMSPRNRDLLEEREIMQRKIDEWHKGHPGPDYDRTAYRAFLVEIGYLLPEPEPFSITAGLIDEEVSTRPGPQLVVPIMNARYSLNATNARWGSLYDSLYGTNAIPSDGGAEATPGEYNPIRGARVIAFAKTFLNDSCPLADGSSHTEVSAYTVDTSAPSKARLCAELSSGGSVGLLCPEQFKGYNGPATAPTNILLEHNGLHIDIHIDRSSVIGGSDSAGVRDVVLESAMTAIQDCEDSVAAVDAADKALVYRNWLGLMRGDLTEEVSKSGKTFNRTLNPDRHYIAVDGSDLQLKGRSLLFIRNVGHLMRNEAILDGNNEEVFEGIMDAMFTALIALYDLNKKGVGACNSRTGSVYIVKPKMHGPEEVSFTCDLFDRVEDAMGMPRHTLKLGIMDEERRTTVNLKECIRRARDRVVFVNTGFLDRTGDEIHTSMHAGIITPKSEMKKEKWLSAYERWNASIGLQCGFKGRAQIGKGMWATPDLMDAMLAEKGGHLRAGASTSWVPSPTAATLHATHYHAHDVSAIQEMLLQQLNANPILDDVLSDILYVPLVAAGVTLAPEMVQRELDNNAQGILGYVVRWINNGVGCSKIPDINNVGLMEDRATLRISSQYIANWLLHNVCSPEQVQETLKRMAAIVDTQNVGPDYQPMSADFDNSVAFQAAVALVFEGMRQPSGYTEPILHARRRELKATR